MEAFVTSEVRHNIAHITFGTPKSNSMPGVILRKLAQISISESKEEEVKAILLKSAGDRAFCAGASFEELIAVEKLEDSTEFFGGFAQVLDAMRKCGKIVVVRVQGKATGGGVGIACAADYCFATKHASLALTEINLGIGPFVIGPYVERKIGKSQFISMAIDGCFRDADWAKEKGIYNSVSSDIEEMDGEISGFLGLLDSRNIDALSLIKKISWEDYDYFSNLMPERVKMSATLVLQDSAKKSIKNFKEKLKKK